MNTSSSLPPAIAIAGAWGYIGRKFLEASRRLNVPVYAHDPGPVPTDLNLDGVTIVPAPEEFYALDVGFYHLALHPHHREDALRYLAQRTREGKGVPILNEKPIAPPDQPEQCAALEQLERDAALLMLFDFPQLFDPLTHRIWAWLDQFSRVEIREITLEQSKDREDPANPRNNKTMVPIQYQESVHCIAFAVALLDHVAGHRRDWLAHGIRAVGKSWPYTPPNPEYYTYVVDGEFDGSLALGSVTAWIHTNFRRHAPWKKRRCIRGIADGKPFEIETEFLEGHKSLHINAEDQSFPSDSCSYEHTIRTFWHYVTQIPRNQLLTGTYPNLSFSQDTFRLSNLLWESSYLSRTIEVVNQKNFEKRPSLLPQVVGDLPRYDAQSV